MEAVWRGIHKILMVKKIPISVGFEPIPLALQASTLTSWDNMAKKKKKGGHMLVTFIWMCHIKEKSVLRHV